MLYPDFDELIKLGARSSRLRLKTRRRTVTVGAGGYVSPFRGQGLEFEEVREYRAGDDVRHIDWRVTARKNHPHLKVFTEERERTVLLCVDANATMRFGTRGTFRSVQAARAAAMLGWMAQAANDRVGGLVFGDLPGRVKFFDPARSRRALWQMLRALSDKAQNKNAASVPLHEALAALDRAAPTGALVFVISDFQAVTDSMEKIFAGLRRRCDVVLVCVNDPADRDLPPMKSVWFGGAGGARILAGTDSKAGRAAYTRQWLENRARLEDMAKRQRISIIDLNTGGDVYRDIARGLHLTEIRGSHR